MEPKQYSRDALNTNQSLVPLSIEPDYLKLCISGGTNDIRFELIPRANRTFASPLHINKSDSLIEMDPQFYINKLKCESPRDPDFNRIDREPNGKSNRTHKKFKLATSRFVVTRSMIFARHL